MGMLLTKAVSLGVSIWGGEFSFFHHSCCKETLSVSQQRALLPTGYIDHLPPLPPAVRLAHLSLFCSNLNEGSGEENQVVEKFAAIFTAPFSRSSRGSSQKISQDGPGGTLFQCTSSLITSCLQAPRPAFPVLSPAAWLLWSNLPTSMLHFCQHWQAVSGTRRSDLTKPFTKPWQSIQRPLQMNAS